MNNEQTKTPGQIAYEADGYFNWDIQTKYLHDRWERVASAVISHVLQGAKWVLLEIGEEIRPGDEFFDYNRPLDFRWVRCPMGMVGDKIDELHFIHRRPISLTHGATKGASTTQCASSGDTGADATPTLIDDEGFPYSAEPVAAQEKPLPCPWCIPGVDNCHHTQAEIRHHAEPVVEEDDLDALARHRREIRSLTTENAALKEELEDAKESIVNIAATSALTKEINEGITAENVVLKRQRDEVCKASDHVIAANRDLTNQILMLRDEVIELKEWVKDESEQCVTYDKEIRRLRSKFRWTPISERYPTEFDGVEMKVSGAKVRMVTWSDSTFYAVDHWHKKPHWATHWNDGPPLPSSPPETEEQAMRREFDVWVSRNYKPDMSPDKRAVAWLAWQAAKSTGGPA